MPLPLPGIPQNLSQSVPITAAAQLIQPPYSYPCGSFRLTALQYTGKYSSSFNLFTPQHYPLPMPPETLQWVGTSIYCWYSTNYSCLSYDRQPDFGIPPAPRICRESLTTSLIWRGGWLGWTISKMCRTSLRLNPPIPESTTYIPTSSLIYLGWTWLLANHIPWPREGGRVIWMLWSWPGVGHRPRIWSPS